MHQVTPRDDGRKKEPGSTSKGLHRPEIPWAYFIVSPAAGITLQKPFLTNSNTGISVLKINVYFVSF